MRAPLSNGCEVLRWRYAFMFFEHSAQMLWKIEAESVGRFRYGHTGGKIVFCFLHYEFTDMKCRRITGSFLNQVTEIVC